MQIILVNGYGERGESSDSETYWRRARTTLIGILFPIAILVYEIHIFNPTVALDPASLWTFLKTFFHKMSSTDKIHLILFIVMLYSISKISLAVNGRLVLTDSEIEKQSRLPKWLKSDRSDWKVSKRDITAIKVIAPMSRPSNATFYRLRIEVGGAKKDLLVLGWRIPGQSRIEQNKVSFIRTAEQARQTVMGSPLVRAFQDAGYDVLATALKVEDPLRKSRPAIGLVILHIMLVAYMVIGMSIQREFYIGTPPYLLMVGVGVAGALFAFAVLARSQVPLGYKAGVIFLVGAAFGGASHPGVRRLNELLYPIHVQPMRHVGGHLVAEDGSTHVPLPYADYIDFWASVPADRTFDIGIREGVFGIRQMNRDSVSSAVADYDEAKYGK